MELQQDAVPGVLLEGRWSDLRLGQEGALVGGDQLQEDAVPGERLEEQWRDPRLWQEGALVGGEQLQVGAVLSRLQRSLGVRWTGEKRGRPASEEDQLVVGTSRSRRMIWN